MSSLLVSLTTPILVLLLAIALPFCRHPFLPNDEHPFRFDDYIVDRAAASTDTSRRRNIVVTGGCSGLGYATVQHLARVPGLNIILACRNVERCRKAQRAIIPGHHATTSTHCVEDGGLDLSDLASVHRYATQLLPAKLASLSSDDPSIYALVNNAGQWSPSTELTYSKQGNNNTETTDARLHTSTTNGMETHMLVNHIGHVYLTHLLWKLLQAEKGRARVVTVSSAVAVFPVSASRFWYESDSKSWWETHSRFLQHIMAYSRSKRANLMFAAELHHRYSKHNTTTGGNVTVRSIATHPGYTRTALLTQGMRFAAWLGDAMSKNYWGSMSPAEGAMTQVRAVLDETLSSGVYIGPKYLSHGPPVPLGDVHGWTLHHWPFSRETSRELWESSLKALGIEEFGEVVADNMTVRQA